MRRRQWFVVLLGLSCALLLAGCDGAVTDTTADSPSTSAISQSPVAHSEARINRASARARQGTLAQARAKQQARLNARRHARVAALRARERTQRLARLRAQRQARLQEQRQARLQEQRQARLQEQRQARQRAKQALHPAANCTPGYSPCIPPASDVDCAGGSGNGPVYVQGPVRVSGSDPYNLDADGDGIGCEDG